MEFSEVIQKRQSIRKYKKGDIPKDDLMKIIETASLAPSGKNIQNWHFVVVKDDKIKQEIAHVISQKNEELSAMLDQRDADKGRRFRKFVRNFTLFFQNAPVLLVVFSTFYAPSGYHEYKEIGLDPDTDLVFHQNPGMQSLGAALENLTLEAVNLGYGSCWLTSANYAADGISAYLKEKHGFEKEGFFMAALMSLGVPEDNQPSPKKKSPEEITTWL